MGVLNRLIIKIGLGIVFIGAFISSFFFGASASRYYYGSFKRKVMEYEKIR